MSDVKESSLFLISQKNRSQLSNALAELLEPRTKVREIKPRAVVSMEQEVVQEKDEPIKSDNNQIDSQQNSSFHISEIPIDKISFSPFQTREILDEAELEDLAKSITNKGIIQPIIVRSIGGGYELVAGEGRLRAAKLAGLEVVPAIVRKLEDRESAELTIIENAQREDLNPIEEALAYKKLTDQFKVNQTEVANVIGKNRATISNSLRLLQLEPEVIELLKTGELSAGHGRSLLMLDDKTKQVKLAQRVVRDGLSVRALESLVSKINDQNEEEPELSEEEQKTLAAIDRQETKLKNLLEIEKLKLSVDTQGRKRLTMTFDTEASFRSFMGRIRD